MKAILNYLFKRIITRGKLEVTFTDGSTVTFGGREPGFNAHIHFHSKRAEFRCAINPELAVGEAYMDGELSFADSNGPLEFLELVGDNWNGLKDVAWTKWIGKFRFLTRGLRQLNSLRRARRNVAHHYDLDERLYRLFLDPDMQYSCAYFEDGVQDIETAQQAKKRHIISKLALAPGVSVLDIGCGWGGLGLAMARLGAAKVVGVTLSEEQQRVASERAKAEGLNGQARFELKDYRLLTATFDRIVSVGMFEHVGVGHYAEYFDHIKRLLAPNGVALIHSVARFGRPAVSNPWITKYIFPGGYVPAFSELMPVIERSGLYVTDLETLRLHYAETLKVWRQRFRQHWSEAAKLYDERFCRMWDFDLAGFEAAFRDGTLMIVQVQLTKNLSVLPLTRDYMFETEQRLRNDAEFTRALKPAVAVSQHTLH